MKKLFFAIGLAAYLLVVLFTPLSHYESLSVGLFCYFILSFVGDLGKKLVILDVAIIISIITCLLLPIAGYHYFTALNTQSRLWVNYMRVPSEEYYSFMLPATVSMMLGMKIPVFYHSKVYWNHEQYMIKVKAYLANAKWQGLILVAIGLSASILKGFVPSGLSFVLFLLSYLMFVGIFYCLYSNMPFKRTLLVCIFAVLTVRSITAGMFGEMIFMAALSVILILLGNKMQFLKKLGILLLGIFGIIMLQAIKPSFRQQTWKKTYQGSQISVFADVFKKKISNPAGILDDQRMLFIMYSRFNQGQIVSNVLNSVPRKYPFAHGETIAISLAASVVPRVLWPDKPLAGGTFNFKRFLGITLKGWSANISPFGDAWGNFGKGGGIIFMFCFGLLFNFFLNFMLKVAVKYPSLILWFPYLFFYAVSIENDVMSMTNSFVKSAFFTYFIYKAFPAIFKVKI